MIKEILVKCNQFFAGIGKIDDSEVCYNVGFEKIKFLTDDSLPLGKLIYFPIMTVIIRCVLKQNRIFYPQVYLAGCLSQI